MDVVYHSSDLFAPIMGVSIVSLFENNKSCDEINVWIIENHISIENKEKLNSVAINYGRKIIFIPMPNISEHCGLNLKKIKKEWPFDSYCRLFLDKILPGHVNKVLYLDGDIIINSSLAELWHMDMDGKCAAAVSDSLGEEYYKIFGLSSTAHYCNSGVILMDLERWRDNKVGEKVIEYVKKCNGYVFFMEQTVFNVVLDSEIYILPPEYNVFSLMQCMTFDEHMYLRRPKRFYNKSDVNKAIANPTLIHLTTCFFIVNRAWITNNNHPAKNIYLKYNSLSPWNTKPLLDDMKNNRKRIVDFFVQLLPRRFTILIASYLYRYLRIWKIKQEMNKYLNE